LRKPPSLEKIAVIDILALKGGGRNELTPQVGTASLAEVQFFDTVGSAAGEIIVCAEASAEPSMKDTIKESLMMQI
jgi:hypothetical protein